MGRGWSVPEFVGFNSVNLFGGYWAPFPIDMSFCPSSMVLSTVGLSLPGLVDNNPCQERCSKHLHQLHVCLPTDTLTTTLLYRMSLDFMPWLILVPFKDIYWDMIAEK